MKQYGIRFVAPGSLYGNPRVGAWLRSFDPEAFDGRGHVVWTMAPERAARFPSVVEAHAVWCTSPRCHPVRDDGKPNRPLTAFTVSIEELP